MHDPLKPLASSLPTTLASLERQARAASALAAAVRAALPEELRPHVLMAAQRGEELALTVDSAAWAARVRYAATRLKDALAQPGRPAVTKIRVRVRGP